MNAFFKCVDWIVAIAWVLIVILMAVFFWNFKHKAINHRNNSTVSPIH